ncbi:hypothetical protein TWF106_001773 [Orbilia oligospora]|uniref:Small ribosomal subunit protein uS7 domain-containing protein n=1 Tax=Orbilia oligospora TaxID=2813651 RepID=A0A6G1M3Z2_ORBOL|nr:hypothetical protein TWF788_007012 [Orbilia oligospora]KAF3217973.1 hypothetical protein TWF679_001387 [Orbilia oligospora]KAF3218660.1 hypothetical protein TWF191_008106 [Orbilia oligospora]KAF3225900.1 hypothetical protein TWF106_001773 [Orbilia oligospora]KAF3244255.1 hypothetical protein TWF192_007816 [Orbilia oligospora]
MAAPLSFLRPSALRALERLPLGSASRPISIPSRRCLATFAPRPHRFGPTTTATTTTSGFAPLYQRRSYSDSKSGESELTEGSVTEEASKTAEIMGDEGVNVEEFGTPASEIFKRENDVENAPEIVKEELSKPTTSLLSAETTAMLFPPDALNEFSNPTPKVVVPPYRPAIPLLPIPALHSIHHRDHPLLRQLTPCFMKHGELATAQATVQKILQILRTKPAPREGKYPLVPNAPDLSLLPGDPVAYLQTAIDSIAPLFKLKSTRGSGGSVNQVPVPLPVKTRRRKALQWMLQAADGKKRMKSLPERFAEEVESVVLGTSSCWDKRLAVHKLCVTNRANVSDTGGKKKKRMGR